VIEENDEAKGKEVVEEGTEEKNEKDGEEGRQNQWNTLEFCCCCLSCPKLAW
jgi:hypothetical protein